MDSQQPGWAGPTWASFPSHTPGNRRLPEKRVRIVRLLGIGVQILIETSSEVPGFAAAGTVEAGMGFV